jgi:hypothetical protein
MVLFVFYRYENKKFQRPNARQKLHKTGIIPNVMSLLINFF